MQYLKQSRVSSARENWTEPLEQTIRTFLSEHLGSTPKHLTVLVTRSTILARAFDPFPEATLRTLSTNANDSLYHQYYDGLFRVSATIFRRQLSEVLGCEVRQIRHTLHLREQELDIIVDLNETPIENNTEERSYNL